MKAAVGDRITMAAEHVDGRVREGTIREVHGEGGGPPEHRQGWGGPTRRKPPPPRGRPQGAAGGVLKCESAEAGNSKA